MILYSTVSSANSLSFYMYLWTNNLKEIRKSSLVLDEEGRLFHIGIVLGKIDFFSRALL